MYWLTSDLHLGDTEHYMRGRPFKNPKDCDNLMLSNLKKFGGPNDALYVVGDLFNYNRNATTTWLHVADAVSVIGIPIYLIIGNNEDRIIKDQFYGDMQFFGKWCRQYNIILLGYTCEIMADTIPLHLVHDPLQAKPDMFNIYGHAHSSGRMSHLGFNVAQDLNGYIPVSEELLKIHIINLVEFFSKPMECITTIKDLSLWRRYYKDIKHKFKV